MPVGSEGILQVSTCAVQQITPEKQACVQASGKSHSCGAQMLADMYCWGQRGERSQDALWTTLY